MPSVVFAAGNGQLFEDPKANVQPLQDHMYLITGNSPVVLTAGILANRYKEIQARFFPIKDGAVSPNPATITGHFTSFNFAITIKSVGRFTYTFIGV
jgi:hypothetical protein